MYFWMGLPKYVFNKNADFALEDWPGSLAPRVPAALPALGRVTGSKLRSQEHVVGSLLSLCAPSQDSTSVEGRLKQALRGSCHCHGCSQTALLPAASTGLRPSRLKQGNPSYWLWLPPVSAPPWSPWDREQGGCGYLPLWWPLRGNFCRNALRKRAYSYRSCTAGGPELVSYHIIWIGQAWLLSTLSSLISVSTPV